MSKDTFFGALVSAWETLSRLSEGGSELDENQLERLEEIAEEMQDMSKSKRVKWKNWGVGDSCIKSATNTSSEYKCELTAEELANATKFVKSLIVHQESPRETVVCRHDSIISSETELHIRQPPGSEHEFSVETSVEAEYRDDYLTSMDLEFTISTSEGEAMTKKAHFTEDSKGTKKTKSSDRGKWEDIAESCGLGRKCGIFLWYVVIYMLESEQEAVFGNFYSHKLDP